MPTEAARKVRRPLFDGTREVRALWFDVGQTGEAEARRRILARWRVHARLYRVGDGYLLEFPAARRERCAALDALALCERGGVLASAPLGDDERAAAAGANLLIVRGSRVESFALTPADRVDPAAWLEVSRIPIHEPIEARHAEASPSIEAPPSPKPVREILARIPPPSAKREAFLRNAAAAARKKMSGSWLGKGGAGDALGGAALGAMGLIASWFGIRSRRAAGAPRLTGLTPFAQRIANLATRLSLLSGAAKLFGWRQAAYLRRMLRLFEEGKWDDALRHAIPLGALLEAAARAAFGTPQPRLDLKITRPSGASASIFVERELGDYLRALYRRTFERLDREGRVDEAVFVLAELLGAGQEAVTYLEGKGRTEQAAELAETLDLPASIAVRLWWMAGDRKRAARLARLGNAFADAVRLLEGGHSPKAHELRLLWAEHLAARGDLLEAVDALWPLQAHRDQALVWLLQAEQSETALSVRALGRKLALLPERLSDSAEAIRKVLEDATEDGAQRRARLARELLDMSAHSDATRKLAAELLRGVLAERLAGANAFDRPELERLVQTSGDRVLKADLPRLELPASPPAQALASRPAPLVLRVEERALQPIHDAHWLAGELYLLALGESGAICIDRRGRVLAHYPVPAHRLVTAPNGVRALALAQRDRALRVSRLDLVNRKMDDWISRPLTFWSDQYDGVTWNVVADDRLLAVDTTQDHFAVLWQVADLPGTIVGFAEDDQLQVLLIRSGKALEQWRYVLPSRRLIQRDALEPVPRDAGERLLPASSLQAPLRLRLLENELEVVPPGPDAYRIALGQSSVLRVNAHETWLLVVTRSETEACCIVAELHSGRIRAELRLGGATREPRARVQSGHVLMFDQSGRLIDIDCQSGRAHTVVLS